MRNNFVARERFCNNVIGTLEKIFLLDQIDPSGFQQMAQFLIEYHLNREEKRNAKNLASGILNLACLWNFNNLEARIVREIEIEWLLMLLYRFSYKFFGIFFLNTGHDNFVIKRKRKRKGFELIKNYNIARDTENARDTRWILLLFPSRSLFASRQRVEIIARDIEKIRAARIVHHRGRWDGRFW